MLDLFWSSSVLVFLLSIIELLLEKPYMCFACTLVNPDTTSLEGTPDDLFLVSGNSSTGSKTASGYSKLSSISF